MNSKQKRQLRRQKARELQEKIDQEIQLKRQQDLSRANPLYYDEIPWESHEDQVTFWREGEKIKACGKETRPKWLPSQSKVWYRLGFLLGFSLPLLLLLLLSFYLSLLSK